jgi:hypothetical protein
MKLKIYLFSLIAILSTVFAVPVDKQTAEAAAKNWLNAKSGDTDHETVSEYINFDNSVHIFNFENGGFALIAADDASLPVLGYSFNGEFNNSEEKSNINFWLGLYKKAIDEIRTKKLSNEKTLTDWKNVLSGNISKSEGKAVEPLLTSTWNQSPIYNMYCPLDGSSLSVVGCVATAMAQVMYYHKYPATGKSSSSYSTLGQNLSADYYLSKYNWDLMPDALSSSSSVSAKHEVAQISYHAGVAVEMMYGSDGSGAYSEDVPFALENYFKYNTAAVHEYRSTYSSLTWRTMLQDQLNKSQPVYYSGQGPDGGHAFVCDGYQDEDFYHFNWGWGGSADGYFSIDNLNPSGMTFNSYQAVVRDIIPKTIDLVLSNPIADVQTNESSYQIDLSEHFTSVSGDIISYAVDPKSSINGLQYNITSGILTLNKLENGISRIIVTSSTRNDNNFDEFYIQFGQSDLTAGFGKSYNFNSTAYLDAGNSTEANSMSNISFSAWVKLNSINREHGIASKALSSNSGWYVLVQSNNLIKFSVKTQDGITRRIYSLSPLEAEKWYHLDLVYDGKDFYIYINGELDNIKTTYTAASSLSNDIDRNIMLGNVYGIYMDGEIDEAVLWNNAVGLTQIREIMGQVPEITKEGLVSYWPLNEGFYATAQDMTGLHNGAFINNDLSYWQESEAPLYFFMDWNTSLNSSLLGSPSETAFYNITKAPSMGSIELSNAKSGEFIYTPQAGLAGLEEIKYTITYSKGTTPEKTVLISVKETTGIEENDQIPIKFNLSQNYPNPFNPETRISFTLNSDMDTKLVVYDMTGSSVRTLHDGFSKAGKYDFIWDGKTDLGKSLSSGIYYFRLSSDELSSVKKAVMLK